MEIGKVVGNVWATRKNEELSGQKLMVVKLLKAKDIYKDDFLVASDNIGAGIGDMVLITKGSSAREAVIKKTIPIDAAIVGIIDTFEIEDE